MFGQPVCPLIPINILVSRYPVDGHSGSMADNLVCCLDASKLPCLPRLVRRGQQSVDGCLVVCMDPDLLRGCGHCCSILKCSSDSFYLSIVHNLALANVVCFLENLSSTLSIV